MDRKTLKVKSQYTVSEKKKYRKMENRAKQYHQCRDTLSYFLYCFYLFIPHIFKIHTIKHENSNELEIQSKTKSKLNEANMVHNGSLDLPKLRENKMKVQTIIQNTRNKVLTVPQKMHNHCWSGSASIPHHYSQHHPTNPRILNWYFASFIGAVRSLRDCVFNCIIKAWEMVTDI